MADRKLIVMDGGLLQQLQSGDDPVAPTQSAGDNSTKVATTAFVQGAAKWTESSKSADWTVTATTNVLYRVSLGGGNVTATLPTYSGNGVMVIAFKVTIASGTNTLTIDGNASEDIDGALTCVLRSLNDCVILACDGASGWRIISDTREKRTRLPGFCNRRLTLESGVPISTSNQSAKGTIYWTPFRGSAVSLYHSTEGWDIYSPPEIAFPLTATSGKNYDVFASRSKATPSSTNTGTDIVTFGSATGWSTGAAVQVAATGGGLTTSTWYYWNAASTTTGSFHTTLANALAGTSKVDLTANITAEITGFTLSQSSAWTNDTTRADALGEQDGVITSGSDATKLWLGGYRASGTNVTAMEFSGASPKMFLSNWFNPVESKVIRVDTTSSWNYTISTWRQARGSADNQIEIFTCTNAYKVDAGLNVASYIPTGNDESIGIGVDSTTPSTNCSICYGSSNNSGLLFSTLAHSALGYRVYKWCELRTSVGTASFIGEQTSGGNIYVRSMLTTALLI